LDVKTKEKFACLPLSKTIKELSAGAFMKRAAARAPHPGFPPIKCQKGSKQEKSWSFGHDASKRIWNSILRQGKELPAGTGTGKRDTAGRKNIPMGGRR
jgi:hypothetical protein